MDDGLVIIYLDKTATWDGKTSTGWLLPNGGYTVLIESRRIDTEDTMIVSHRTVLVAGDISVITDIRVVPNPATGPVKFIITGQAVNNGGRVAVRIYNIAGELVRTLIERGLASSDIEWDLRNGSGDMVSGGVYIGLFEVYDPVAGVQEKKMARVVVIR